MGVLKPALCVRGLISSDIPAVLEIERGSFVKPWTEDEFKKVLAHNNCVGIVAEAGKQVTGFVIYEMFRSKFRLLNVAVHPGHRRKGYGTAMLAQIAGKLEMGRQESVVGEVCESNLPVQLFLRHSGFRAVEIQHGYFKDKDEDGYLFELRAAQATKVSEAKVKAAQYLERNAPDLLEKVRNGELSLRDAVKQAKGKIGAPPAVVALGRKAEASAPGEEAGAAGGAKRIKIDLVDARSLAEALEGAAGLKAARDFCGAAYAILERKLRAVAGAEASESAPGEDGAPPAGPQGHEADDGAGGPA
jgi:ribosomal-protein-alanine N-acetyltransferase